MGNKLKVFISYRRADSKDFSFSLFNSLKDDFQVFFDIEGGIDYGNDFPEVLKSAVEETDVLLMVIGSKCCEEFKNKEGKIDFVEEEIKHARENAVKIIPVLMDGVDMPKCFPKSLSFVPSLNAYLFGRGTASMYMNNLKKILKEQSPKISNDIDNGFVKEVSESIERDKLLVLFSQELTKIDEYYRNIKLELQARFSNEFYLVSIPSFVSDELEYFSCIANDCGISCEVKRVSDWQKAIKKKLEESSEPLLLFVRDIENGDEVLDKQFATIVRNLKNEYAHFHAVLVGRKALAKLVYGEGVLSPLNNAKELFFPETTQKLGAEKIHQQFQTLGRQRTQICQLLGKKNLGRFSTWSFNDTLNQLFWKNLLVREGNKFAWRGELTKEIAREAFGCGEDVV